MDFKEKLKHLREQNNLTLQEIAEYIGVSKPTVQRWESGEIKNLKRDKIKLLSEVLNTTPAYLMGWSDDDTNLNTIDNTNLCSDLEMEIVKKYRSLDLRGQKAVLDTLNRECEFAGSASTINGTPTLIEDALHTIDNLVGVTATINQHQPTRKK